MEMESYYYTFLISFIKITSYAAAAYIIYFIKKTNEPTLDVGFFRIYFLIILFVSIFQSVSEFLELPIRFDSLLVAYIVATTVLLMALEKRARVKSSLRLIFGLLTAFILSVLFLEYSDFQSLLIQTLFGIVVYTLLSYIVIKKGRTLSNIGYFIMAFAFVMQVLISLVELYFILMHDLTLSYFLALFATNSGVMLVIIGFLGVKLIDEHKYLNSLALTDTLTGMNNRRGLQYMLQTVVPSYNRAKTCFSVVTMDIDFFKKINDRYGHDGGDIALKQFSNLIKNSHRNSDISARLGGEEFLLVLTDTDKYGALAIAEKLRKSTEELKIIVNETSLNITCSFGVSTGCQESIDMDTLVKNADKALYLAKYKGRNQVIHIDEDNASIK